MNDKTESPSIPNPHPFNPESILITGGCGFIGLNLIKFLIKKRSKKLRILDNLSVGTRENFESILSEFGNFKRKQNRNKFSYNLALNPSIPTPLILELVIGDIRDKQTCFKAIEGIDAVIHLAAHAGVIPSIEDPYFDFEVNVLGTLNMLWASVKNKVDKFIFASSNAPLGDQSLVLESLSLNPKSSTPSILNPKPVSPYGASKLACEGYCSAFYTSYGLKTTSLRFSNVYGPHSTHKTSVIAKFFKGVFEGKPLTIYGDGTQTRDFLYVNDLCNAIFLSLMFNENSSNSINSKNPVNPANSIWGEVFQIGTGKETSINELSARIKWLAQRDLGRDVVVEYEKERPGEIIHSCSDISKAKRVLRYTSSVSIDGGLELTWEWFCGRRQARCEALTLHPQGYTSSE